MMEQNSESGTIPESQTLPLIDVMYSIADSQGLDGAVDYESGMQDGQKDALVFLCRSESGKYEAYGFISTEYGKNGLLINNVINDQDNWNFLKKAGPAEIPCRNLKRTVITKSFLPLHRGKRGSIRSGVFILTRMTPGQCP